MARGSTRPATPRTTSPTCSSRPATSRRRRTRRRARSVPIASSSSPTAPRRRTRWRCRRCSAPGDIAIVDRNCHKSHHYGMVLAGAQPLYVEAFPMTEYSMYGAVPLKTIKQALLNLKARRTARSRQDARPDQLHLRRPHLQHPPGDGGMPRDQAGPDLPVGRSLVRLCALLAVPAAAHRDGRRQRHRGLDARSEIGRGLREAAGRARRESVERRAARRPG